MQRNDVKNFCYKDSKKGVERNAMCQKGFTLVELIIILVIIGIMAVVATPAYISLKHGQFCSYQADRRSCMRNMPAFGMTLADTSMPTESNRPSSATWDGRGWGE